MGVQNNLKQYDLLKCGNMKIVEFDGVERLVRIDDCPKVPQLPPGYHLMGGNLMTRQKRMIDPLVSDRAALQAYHRRTNKGRALPTLRCRREGWRNVVPTFEEMIAVFGPEMQRLREEMVNLAANLPDGYQPLAYGGASGRGKNARLKEMMDFINSYIFGNMSRDLGLVRHPRGRTFRFRMQKNTFDDRGEHLREIEKAWLNGLERYLREEFGLCTFLVNKLGGGGGGYANSGTMGAMDFYVELVIWFEYLPDFDAEKTKKNVNIESFRNDFLDHAQFVGLKVPSGFSIRSRGVGRN